MIAWEPNRDEVLSDRFDARLRTFATAVIPAHAIAILINGLLDGRWIAMLAHLAMAALAWVIVRRSTDAVRTIIFSHVYWTFSFMTYLFAVTHLQTAGYGLGDPARSALIALTSQVGLFLAFMVSPSTPPLSTEAADIYLARRRTMRMLQWPLIGLGVIGVFGQFTGALTEAVSSTLVLLLIVAMAIRVANSTGNSFADPLFIIAFIATVVLSVSSNERSSLLAMALFVAVAALMLQRRLLTLPTLIVMYISWRLIYIFSSIVIYVRTTGDSARAAISQFSSHFFTLDTLQAILNPFHLHYADIYYPHLSRQSQFYSPFLGDVTDIFERLTVLPQMDIVVSRWPEYASSRWGELWLIFQSALPSFGQDKLLVFSDYLVWELGLRGRDSIGRPMITAEGELYTVGGYLAVFLVLPLCYLIMHWAYRAIARLTGSRAAATLILSQLFVNTIFSTTVLSVFTGTLRVPLQLIALLATVVFVAERLSERPSHASRAG